MHKLKFANGIFPLAYWVAFGPHGPRAMPDPDENWKVFQIVVIGIGVSAVIFLLIRTQARPAPRTMNAQYQEMTNEYLKVCDATIYECLMMWLRHIIPPQPPEEISFDFSADLCSLPKAQRTEPITGVSSEGYKGKGMVQSKPRKGGIPTEDDE